MICKIRKKKRFYGSFLVFSVTFAVNKLNFYKQGEDDGRPWHTGHGCSYKLISCFAVSGFRVR